VQRGQERVDEGVEVLVPDRREVDELGALPFPDRRIDHVRAAVDRDIVAARDEPARDLLDGGLEPAVAGGDPARSEDRDLHATARA
jgi:hypothetical protein